MNNQDLVKRFMQRLNQTSDEPLDINNITNKDIKNYKLRLTLTIEKTQELFESFLSSDEFSYNFYPLFNIIKNKIKNISEDSLEINKEELAHTLADLSYINYGTSELLNIPLQDCFLEVHRANMSKLDSYTNGPIYREDGKLLYDASYTPPNIKSILDSRTSD